MADAPESTRILEMQFAGTLVKHLGLQMYGGAVPAIAELVANSWDAEARNVWIDVPLDKPLDNETVIVVRDDGHGMSFDECNLEYLQVGRERRKTGGELSKGLKGAKRRLMGRKGIGKLAGFGIANTIRIRTVKGGRVVEFVMDYDDIVKNDKFVERYRPKILLDERTSDSDGTIVTLTNVKITRAVPKPAFLQSMQRRFAVYSDLFKVHICGDRITKTEAEFQFRFPPKPGTWHEEEVSGGGTIRWWIAFSKEPIPDEEARGVSILARGKLVQAPWFFGLSGGVYGQHGLQYMTGEVQADFLDDAEDLVATDRASVLWDHPRARVLQEWGQAKVKELLQEWVRLRTERKVEHLKKRTHLMERVAHFPPRERAELTKAISKLSEIPTLDDPRLEELVDFLIRAYESEHFMSLIRELNAASPEAQAEVLRLLTEWDVLEAIAQAQVVRGHLEIIDTFQKMVDKNVPEKPDLQNYLKRYPWLIDQTWTTLEHERRLETLLKNHFHRKGSKRKGAQRRVDFFCLADAGRVVVVEVKRPGESVGKEELRQLTDYVDWLKSRESQSNDPERGPRSVYGVLVAGTLASDAVAERDRLHPHNIFVRTWERLLQAAKDSHRDFFEVVKKRAPQEDPRIERLTIESPEEPNESSVRKRAGSWRASRKKRK